jgi:hypothetical protein
LLRKLELFLAQRLAAGSSERINRYFHWCSPYGRPNSSMDQLKNAEEEGKGKTYRERFGARAFDRQEQIWLVYLFLLKLTSAN